MVSSSLSNYGVYNPNAVDPSATETALATEVGRGNRGDAANLLSTYQILRETNQGNYNEYMRQQHEFAAQQLQQQLYEQNLKALQEGAKTPGLLSLYGSSPVYQQVLGGGSPEVAATIETNLRNMQRAEQFQKGASGMQEATNAGFQPNSEQAAVATAGLAGPQGTPLQIQVANINAAARMAAARLRAAAASQPTESMQYPNQYGGFSSLNFPKSMSPEERAAWIAQHTDLKPVDPPMANTPPPQASGGTPATNPSRRVPDLPVAKTDTPANTPTQNTQTGAAKMRQLVLANQDKIPGLYGPKAAADIQAGMAKNNGQPNVVPDPSKKSGWAIVGGSGQHY